MSVAHTLLTHNLLTHTPPCCSPQVYPPCDTTSLQTLPLDRKLKQLFLVSVAQFRPEKNHRLQLEAFAAARRAAGPTLQVGRLWDVYDVL